MNGTRLALADVEIDYQLVGHGPPVLLIQGIGVAGSGWNPQVEALQRNFQILTYDNRGLGKSVPCSGPISIEAMARDAAALMDKAGWKSAHVVGHSMGGVIAQQLALDTPERVRSLSLLCTFARGKDAARLTLWVLWMTLRTRLGTLPMRRRAFLEMLWSGKELETANTEELAARLALLIGRDLAAQPPVIFKQLRAMARHDVSSRLSELGQIPTMVISAAEDRIALPRYGRALAEAIPGAGFEEIANASHGVTIEGADLINQRLRNFIGQRT